MFLSCSSVKQQSIIYLLDKTAEKSIYDKINKNDVKSIAFYMMNSSDSTYRLYLMEDFNDDFILKTNRKLFINNQSYPLVFETDYLFYSETKDNTPIISVDDNENEQRKITIPPIDERYKNSDIYSFPRRYLMIHSYFWVIDIHGKLVEPNGVSD